MTQQTKIWAMYDGPNGTHDITKGKWYEVSETSTGFHLIDDAGYKICARWFRCTHIWADNWQRHVGPTPPDAQKLDDVYIRGQRYVHESVVLDQEELLTSLRRAVEDLTEKVESLQEELKCKTKR